MTHAITKECRFCYSYKKPGQINTCCNPMVCTPSSLPMVINNTTRTTERSLLLGAQNQMYQANYSVSVNSTIQYTNNNISLITDTLYQQLLQVRQNRYEPYQPYIPPVIPRSVMELQMNTVNVGVPHSVSIMARCKGSQSVTTTDTLYH